MERGGGCAQGCVARAEQPVCDQLMDDMMRSKPCASTWCQARVCAYINCNTKSTIHDSLRAPRTLTLHTSHSLCASRGASRDTTWHMRASRSRARPITHTSALARSPNTARHVLPAHSYCLSPLTRHARHTTTPHRVSAAHTQRQRNNNTPGPRHASDSTVTASNSHAATRDTTTKTSPRSHSCRRATTSQITPSGRG